MKNLKLIIIIVIILIVGAISAFLLTRPKPCADLNEQQCKKADQCLSVLVPCSGPDCTSKAVFRECKDDN